MSRSRHETGFTMIEVMIALLLTSIAIIGILALYMTQTRASSFSRHMTEASVLASDGLERMRTMVIPVGGTELDITEQAQAGGVFDRVSTATANGIDWDMNVSVSWDEDGVTRTVLVYGRR